MGTSMEIKHWLISALLVLVTDGHEQEASFTQPLWASGTGRGKGGAAAHVAIPDFDEIISLGDSRGGGALRQGPNMMQRTVTASEELLKVMPEAVCARWEAMKTLSAESTAIMQKICRD